MFYALAGVVPVFELVVGFYGIAWCSVLDVFCGDSHAAEGEGFLEHPAEPGVVYFDGGVFHADC